MPPKMKSITETLKEEAPIKHPPLVARTALELLDILDLTDKPANIQRAGFIAFAARQPGLLPKIPDEWFDPLRAMGIWPAPEEVETAMRIGVFVRQHRYIRTPGGHGFPREPAND